jgi:elongation factor Ts
MTIKAGDVKQLRETTGAGMMDCKKALTEAEGDFELAIEILRKQGQKLSDKRADREAKEGVIIAVVSDDRTKGAVIQLSCETDFVAKNDDFVALAKSIADLALASMPADKTALLALPFEGSTLGERIIEQIGVIGEKVEVANYESLEGGQVVPYIHMGYRAGVLVALNKSGDDFFDAGKDVAMQVAAMKPVAVDKDGVSQDVIKKEIEIGMEVARNEGKPEAMLEKIAQGKLNKFFKENTLLAQQFVKDSKMTIAQYLQSLDKELTVTDFKHLKLG